MAGDVGALDWVAVWVRFAAIVAPAWAAGRALRRRAVPGWRGVEAAVGEAVAGLAVLLGAAHVLGAVGWLGVGPLVALLAVVAVVATRTCRRAGSDADRHEAVAAVPPQQPVAMVVSVAALAGAWVARAADAYRVGIVEIDSLRYHLPLAATYRQTGSIVGPYFLELDHLATFAPGDGEVLHAVGMLAFGTDALSPLPNLGWGALALVAAWCFGSRRGVGGAAVAGVAAVLVVPILTITQPGSAKNDVAVIALVLAAVALLDRGSPALAVAAAGVALSVKLTAVAPVAVVVVAVVVVVGRLSAPRRLVAPAIVLLATGSFWYVRNLAVAGTPVAQDDDVLERFGFTVADYLDDGRFLREVAPDGLDLAFGPGWPLVVALAVAGMVVGAWRGDRGVRVAAGAAFASAAMYLVTPYGAGGPPGDPWLFPADTRFVTPALALGVAALAGVARRWAPAVAALVTVAALLPFAASRAWTAWPRTSTGVAVAAAAVVVAGAVAAGAVVEPVRRWRRRSPARALVGAAVVASVVGLLTVLALDPYLDRRWTGDVVQPELAAWTASLDGGRVGIVGVGFQYPLYGRALDVEVRYLGERDGDAGFRSFATCESLVGAIAGGGFDVVLAGGFKSGLETAPEPAWLRSVLGDPEVVLDATIHVFPVAARPVDPSRCPAEPPLEGL